MFHLQDLAPAEVGLDRRHAPAGDPAHQGHADRGAGGQGARPPEGHGPPGERARQGQGRGYDVSAAPGGNFECE